MKTHMKDSSPIVIRLSNNITINNCTFDNNSAVFNGDFYFAASITLDNILGMGDILISNSLFKNH